MYLVLSILNSIHEITNLMQSELLEQIGIPEEEYEQSLTCMYKNSIIIYKRKPNESLVVPYNTVILNTWRANINIQYVTGMYGVIQSHYLFNLVCL